MLAATTQTTTLRHSQVGGKGNPLHISAGFSYECVSNNKLTASAATAPSLEFFFHSLALLDVRVMQRDAEK